MSVVPPALKQAISCALKTTVRGAAQGMAGTSCAAFCTNPKDEHAGAANTLFIASGVVFNGPQKQDTPMMIRFFTPQIFAAFGALIMASTAFAQSAPTGDVRGTYGPWSMLCDTPAGAKFEQCAIMQNVVAADRPDIGLSVVVLKTADGKSRILRVLAPLGVLLPNGLGLFIDGTDRGRAYFVRCFADGCYAEVVLEDTLIAELSKGKSAIFTVFQTPEEGVGIPVDLAKFAEAFAALP
jgi:invasion protein IalB